MRFACGKDMRGIVKVIVPLRGKKRCRTVCVTRMQEDNVTAVFGGEMDLPPGNSLANAFGNLLQDMFIRRVLNLVDSIKP